MVLMALTYSDKETVLAVPIPVLKEKFDNLSDEELLAMIKKAYNEIKESINGQT